MLETASIWLHALPVGWMAVVVFGATYLIALVIHAVVRTLATFGWVHSLKAVSPGMLSPLGVFLALFLAFTASQVWTDNDRAENAVIREASALRGVTLLAASFHGEPETRLLALIRQHIDDAVTREWPMMGTGSVTLTIAPRFLPEALQTAIALTPGSPGQQVAQTQIVAQLEAASEARRQRILVSGSHIGALKWWCVFVQAVCALFAVAVVHSDDRRAGAIALGVFATGIAASVLLITAFDRPFLGELAVTPRALLQVMPGQT
jgi:hypothetical protein